MAHVKGTPAWNKGKGEGWTDVRGYRWRRVLEMGKWRQIREHRYVMQQHLGRRLEPWEQVHHIDGNTDNNSIDNLQLTEATEHMRLHHLGSKRPYEARETVALFARMRAEVNTLREINAEMYEALKSVLAVVESLDAYQRYTPVNNQVRAALAKAEGKQP